VAGGSGSKSPKSYRYVLDSVAPVPIKAETFTLNSPAEGVHTLTVQEEDKAGNWSAASVVATIIVDKTVPAAPKVTGESPSSDPTWTWSAQGGGNGTFRYKLDNGAFSAPTTAKRYNPSTISDVDHTLTVQEQDDHGNWSLDGTFTIVADVSLPTVPVSASLTCSTAGSPIDTVITEMDSEGYRRIFDGASFKGWWSDCQTGHSSAGPTTGAVFKVDPNSRALFTTQSGTNIGGILMTNKTYTNYEMVMDIWPAFGNDGGVFNRSTANGKCFQTSMDYINSASMGGSWGEGGLTSRDYRPFAFGANSQTITIPGNPGGLLSNWSDVTSKLNPANYGCAATGCTQSDWQRLWDANGWNEFKIQFYGGSATGTGNIHMKSWFRKSGAVTWVPVIQDTTLVLVVPSGYVGLQVHGGGRFGGSPGTWYRNIKMRELNDLGEPINLP